MTLFILPHLLKCCFNAYKSNKLQLHTLLKLYSRYWRKILYCCPVVYWNCHLLSWQVLKFPFLLAPLFFCFWLQRIKKNLHKMNHQYLMFLQNTLDFGRLKQMSSSQYSRTFWARSPSMEKIIWYPSHFLKSDNQMLKFSLYSHFHVSREAASKSTLKGQKFVPLHMV